MKPSFRSLRALGLALAVCSLPQSLMAAEGDPFVFNQADLLLGIKAEGGTGVSQNILVNLGNTVAIKNNPNQGIVANISADLIATFGSNWFERTDVLFGAFGNRSNLSPATSPGTPPEEPGRTAYVSRAATSPGAAALRSSLSTTSLGNGCTTYSGLKAALSDLTDANPDVFTQTASGATIMDQATQVTSWANSWTVHNPSGSAAAFAVFSGGIQNSFGQAGTEVFVDVQRMVPSTAATYVTTIGIDNAGNVRLVSTPTQTPFQTWALTFPALDTPAKRLPAADPDSDGVTNLMEFLLNGNPGISDPAILPDLDASGSNFVFTFNRRDDAKAGSTLLFQYGSSLSSWTNVTVTNAGVVGSATIGIVDNSTNPDAITITLPKSVAIGGKLFGRLSYTQP